MQGLTPSRDNLLIRTRLVNPCRVVKIADLCTLTLAFCRAAPPRSRTTSASRYSQRYDHSLLPTPALSHAYSSPVSPSGVWPNSSRPSQLTHTAGVPYMCICRSWRSTCGRSRTSRMSRSQWRYEARWFCARKTTKSAQHKPGHRHSEGSGTWARANGTASTSGVVCRVLRCLAAWVCYAYAMLHGRVRTLSVRDITLTVLLAGVGCGILVRLGRLCVLTRMLSH